MRIICLLFLLVCSLTAGAQNESFEQYRDRKRKEFANYRETQRKKFAEYRRKRNEEFAEFVREKWSEFRPSPLIPKPKDDERPPVVAPKDDELPPPEPTPVPYEDVIQVPQPNPQPEPIVPIEEVPIKEEDGTIPFSFFGTAEHVRMDKEKLLKLGTLDENTLADGWLKLSEEVYTNLIYDCLRIREERQLCDWAYLMMLKEMSETLCGTGSNEAVLLMAYIYCQSGYKMRLCVIDEKLQMLFASEHIIFELPYFEIEGVQYYSMAEIEGDAAVCTGDFPQEKPLSLFIPREQKFDNKDAGKTKHQSEKYAGMVVETTANQNLLDFYATYPTSVIGEDVMTRWAMYANTPLSTSIKTAIYPALRAALKGKTYLEAVNELLNLVQTGFDYEYDDKVWGGDRSFFAEESLHYPYCDCEDRSILFSRLVRDLLKLEVILVFYPGHLATAVHIPNAVQGDYISLNGKNFTICDPTYINAPAGMTMPDMDNATAGVILLE